VEEGLDCDLRGRSVDELPGEGLTSLFGWWKGGLGEVWGRLEGELRSRVVLARLRSVCLWGLGGARVDVDRSRAGVGVGAGR